MTELARNGWNRKNNLSQGEKNMNWKKLFGDDLYSKVYEYAKKKKLTVLGMIRLAIEEYLIAHK